MIVEAGLLTFLRTILIIVVVYYGIKLLVRYLSPILLKWFINKQQDKYRNYTSSFNKQNEDKKEGEIHIKQSKKKPHHTDDLGDYVDYEEVNEKDKDS